MIESASALASSNAHVIKTHHNDTELVRELRKKVSTWYIVVYWLRRTLQLTLNWRALQLTGGFLSLAD